MSGLNLIANWPSELYTYAEAEKALGVSKGTLWRWIKKGKVKGYRLGREVLIEKAVVEPLRK